jgi:DNA-binding CsgD family transcriptional regulator
MGACFVSKLFKLRGSSVGNIVLIFQILLSILVTAGCSNTCLSSNKQILHLDKWEISSGNGLWQPTDPVTWESSPPAGPKGEKWRNFDGYALYRTGFIIHSELAGQQLAFFVSSIDDADIAYLNGKEIGRRGSFPSSESDSSGFRSAVYEPRCYILPQNSLRIDQPNELIIKVYDYSGSGGFNGDRSPIIGPYHLLAEESNSYMLLADLPRSVILSVLTIAVLFLIYRTISHLSVRSLADAAKRIGRGFNPLSFLKERKKSIPVESQMLCKYIITIIVFSCLSWVTLSGTSYKYQITSSESFWFKTPALTLFIAFILIIFTFHAELFESRVLHGFLRAFNRSLGIQTHPGILSLFVIYIAVLPAKESWSISVVSGSLLLLIIFTIFSIYTAFQFIRAGSNANMFPSGRQIRIEGIIRILLIGGFITGIALFSNGTPFIRSQSTLLVVVFAATYLLLSLYFYHRYHVAIPGLKQRAQPLAELLKSRYHFTPKESVIAEELAAGISREAICSKHSISNGTMKIHLKSIYSKTIDTDPYARSKKSGKLQRLTIFLHSLDRSND